MTDSRISRHRTSAPRSGTESTAARPGPAAADHHSDGPVGIERVVEVAARHARHVDAESRFPAETLSALRAEGLLGLTVPAHLGGSGVDEAGAVAAIRRLGAACGSSGLVYAMHLSQVACLVAEAAEHPGGAAERLARAVAGEALLIASATTEIGVGGDVTRSLCHLDRQEADGSFRLTKNAPVVSYAEHADVVLVTARRDADAVATDQVLVVCPRAGLALERTSTWDAMGFRGTESHGYVVTATVDPEAVLRTPYDRLSTRVMLPHSHLYWAAAWSGIADAALGRARAVVRRGAKRSRDTGGVAALRLAELTATCTQLDGTVTAAVAQLEDPHTDRDSVAFAVAMNSLKVTASDLLSTVALQALRICGLAGYRRSGDDSLDRIVRDALGAPLMINNDRILANNAGLALALRGAL